MSKYIDLYNQKKKTAAGAIEMIRNRDWIFTAQAAAEPVGILQELQHLKDTGVQGYYIKHLSSDGLSGAA